MSYNNKSRHFRKVCFNSRVSVFIFTGVGIMFLTFLTKDNPLELGIAGIASIFIGIGVNNFTAIETEQKDERKLNRKTQRAIETLQHIQVKIKKTKALATSNNNPKLINSELEEMCDYIELSVQYMEEA